MGPAVCELFFEWGGDRNVVHCIVPVDAVHDVGVQVLAREKIG
jgi:hypothetical protein